MADDADGRTPRGECGNCGSRFPEDETWSYKGFNFCPGCALMVTSWQMDAPADDDTFSWVDEDSHFAAPDSDGSVAMEKDEVG